MLSDSADCRRMAAMTGSTGFVGGRMQSAMQERANWCIAAIGRDDLAMGVDAIASKLDGADVVMNLAGAPIIARWPDDSKKRKIDKLASGL